MDLWSKTCRCGLEQSGDLISAAFFSDEGTLIKTSAWVPRALFPQNYQTNHGLTDGWMKGLMGWMLLLREAVAETSG